jgi:hypothetical protein
MGQITIYLDDETDALMRAAVKTSGLSQSKWVAGAVLSRVHNEWPEAVRALAGAWPDLPSAARIRGRRAGAAARERL